MTELRVPGFDPVELLGYGSGGEVWLARERVTGRPVALKRLRAGADLAARDRLRREAAVLAGVEHPHVVRLRSVHGDGDAFVLVLDLAPGGSLARLLATRRRLAPGEVVTVAVPLAQALAAVHGQGLVHGDVTPANVLFAADGRPLLSDLGVSRLLGSPPAEVGGTRGFLDPAVAAGAAPGPASDVHGLAATCLTALTGVPPYDEAGCRVPVPEGTSAALLGALEPALARDPAARPSAEALAVAVFDAAAAEPVRFDQVPGRPGLPRPADPSGQLGETVPPEQPGLPLALPTHRVSPGPQPVRSPAAARSGRRRAPRGLRRLPGRVGPGPRVALAAALGAATVGLAVVTGMAWAGSDAAPRAGRLAGPVPPSGWAATLAGLDEARSRAFAEGDAARLRAVYAAGAPALARDRSALGRLTDAGLRADGLRLTARSVTVRGRAGGRVRLAVTDVMPPYRLVDAAGVVASRRPGRGVASWTVVLAREHDGWKVYDVVRG